ncbi:MAG: hypothetical protein ACFB5Z_15385 [Elainellaceae cyanobacterium]
MTPNDNLNAGIPEAGAAPSDEAIVKAGGPNDPTTPPDAAASPEVLSTETEALVNALRTRAMSEANAAGEFARDTYLNAVRQARQNVEQNKLVDPNEMEKAIAQLQLEAEKNWETLVNDVATFGDRLSEAAKAAWETFTKGNSPKA